VSDPAATLDRLVAKAGRLYSLPTVVVQVLELTGNPQVDTRALKECIENDPALTSKILRVVNSSLFGLSREVSDLNQALALLGIKPLKLLVLGFSLPGELFANVHGKILAWYWRHTLTKAVAGREISESIFHVPGDDAFIAGLLQDLGILLLIQGLGEPYVRFLEKVIDADKHLAVLETELLGFDHTDLSARLLAHWQLPETLTEAVGWKPPRSNPSGDQATGVRTPRAAFEQALPQILQLSELLARLLADRQGAALGQLLELGRDCAGLTEDQLESLVGNLEEKVRHLADVLSLELPGGLGYNDVLAQAHAQLSDVAAEAAADLLGDAQNAVMALTSDSLVAEFRGLAEAVASITGPPGGRSAAESSQGGSSQAESAAGQTPATDSSTFRARSFSGSSLIGATMSAADPALSHRLAVAVAACRQSRCPLSLLLVELDRADELLAIRGRAGFEELMRFLETACRSGDRPGVVCLPHREAGFALVLPNCERRVAIEVGYHLIGEVHRRAPPGVDEMQRTVNVSVGVATVALPPKNFNGDDLLAAAARCLYGSQASGGGVVKSIEMC